MQLRNWNDNCKKRQIASLIRAKVFVSLNIYSDKDSFELDGIKNLRLDLCEAEIFQKNYVDKGSFLYDSIKQKATWFVLSLTEINIWKRFLLGIYRLFRIQ